MIYAGVASVLGLGIRGGSYPNFLASSVDSRALAAFLSTMAINSYGSAHTTRLLSDLWEKQCTFWASCLI